MKVDYLDFNRLLWGNVTYSQVENILTLSAYLSISCLFPLINSLLILFLGLLLLLNNTLDPHISERCDKSVDTSIRVYGETVLQLQEFFSGVVVDLGESYIGDGVGNLKGVLRSNEGRENMLVGVEF